MKFTVNRVFEKLIVLLTIVLMSIITLTAKSSYMESNKVETSKRMPEVFSFLFDDLPEQKDLELNGSREALNTLRDLRNRNALIWKVKHFLGSKGVICRELNNEDSQLLMIYRGGTLIEVLRLEYDGLIVVNVEERYWYYQWNEDYQRVLDNEFIVGDSR